MKFQPCDRVEAMYPFSTRASPWEPAVVLSYSHDCSMYRVKFEDRTQALLPAADIRHREPKT